MFVNAAREMLKIGDKARAVELLDKCQESVPEEIYPLDMVYLGFINEYAVVDMIETYYMAGAPEKALEMSEKFADQLFVSTLFYLDYYDFARNEFENCYKVLQFLADLSDHNGQKEFAASIRDRFNAIVEAYE